MGITCSAAGPQAPVRSPPAPMRIDPFRSSRRFMLHLLASRSFVTRHAIHRGMFLVVAIHTPGHLKVPVRGDTVELADLPVARAAFEARSDMPLVREVDVRRKLMHPGPRDRLTRVRKRKQFLYLGMFSGHGHVAGHAKFNGWSPCGLICFEMLVAECAIGSLFNMNLVREENGLLRGSAHRVDAALSPSEQR